MKLISKLFIATLALTIIWSCSDDEIGAQLHIGGPFSLTAPDDGSSYTLSEETINETAFTVTYEAADFGFASAPSYQLQIDEASGDFSSPVNVGPAVNALTIAPRTSEINNAVLALGVTAGIPTTVQARVVATLSNTIESIVSNTINLTITTIEVEYPYLHVPGEYQGWNPADENTIIYSLTRDGRYDGYLYFANVSEFKFTEGPSWDVNWGDSGADGILDPNGDNILSPSNGMLRLRVNINDLTYSITPTNWGVIGDATPGGWDNDTDMVYDDASRTLKLTTDLSAGEIKFRANDAWDLNYGDTGADGFLEEGGDNIKVDEAGNYTIELDLNGPLYTYQLIKN